MSVFDEWGDFAHTIFEAQKLIQRQKHSWRQDELDIMALKVELNFLYTSACYNNTWSSDAAQEFKEYVQSLQRFNVHPFKSEASKVLHVLLSLEKKLCLLKLEVSSSYDGSLSTPSLEPPSTFSWNHFYRSLQSNIQYLSRSDKKPEEKSDAEPENKPEEEQARREKPKYKSDDLDNFLKQQLKALLSVMNSLEWLIASRYYVRSPWVENMRAHFGGFFLQIAHLCCLCWYKGLLDKNRQKDVGSALSDLCRKLDPATLEFLDIALGFLRKCDEKHAEVSVFSFLYYVFDSTDKREILHKELATLLTYLIKVPEMDGMDVQRFLEGIKFVIREARYLKGNYWGSDKADLALLFAKIWSLKAEIFVKRVGSVLVFSKKVVTQALYEGCKFLEEISTLRKKSSAEDQIVQLIHRIPKQVESLYQCPDDEEYSVHHKVSDSLLKSLVYMILLKAKELLLMLMEDVSFKQIGFLHEGLYFLIQSDIIQAKEITGYEKPILIDMEVVASGVIFVYNKFQAEKGNEEAGQSMKIQIANLLAKVQHLKAKLKELYLQIPMFILPKTRGFFIIQLLLLKLSDLLISMPDSIAHTIHQIEVIHWDLEFVVLTIKDVSEQNIENSEFEDLHAQLVDKAYQVEHVIDIMLGENEVVWQHILWIYHLSEQIRDIKIQLTDGVRILDVPQSQQPGVSQVSTPSVGDVIVGSTELKEKIIDRLTWGENELQYVSIVGMPGIGKTTLANNVFCSQKVQDHFLVRAWCCVSQNYREREVLLDILSHIIIPFTENTRAMSTADLHNLLRKELKGKGKRYLVVLDDVWSTKALDDFNLSFPKDVYGSKILLTSRLHDEVSKISADVLPLKELSTEESWELLKLKIFGKEKCPEDLLEVGQEIAKNCKGLPLAIGAIAGLLDRACGRSQVLWKQMAKNVSPQIVKDPETQCKRLLELSYNHLPNHLKACLLYFGAFPEDKDIPVQRLQWLWISEGFVCDVKNKPLEDLAKEYLMDLVGRSLVIVGKRKSNGEVKACRVHDVVRDLCLLKAKDDIFMQLISAKDEPYSSLDNLEFGLLYESFNASNSVTYDQYRLCVCVDREQFVVSRPSGQFVRSLIFSGTADTSSRCSYDVSFIPENFERLRLLDLESINMGNTFGSRIELLVQLRYLAFCGDMEFIPSSLSKLRNLVILNVEGLKRKVVLPETIWRMKYLRHIHVSTHVIFTLPTDQNERSLKLDSLVTLSLPYFLLVKETNEILQKFPSLQKLKCVFSSLKHSSMDFQWPPALESLSQLKSLNISYYGQSLNSGKLALPTGLKKLVLSKFCLSRDHISEIGRLENLEILKLISCAFEGPTWDGESECMPSEGPTWDMTEGDFKELQYLELENLNIVGWNGESECLPVLQQLVMRNCEHLKKVDIDFCGISTLDKIDVWLCSSIYDSLKQIQDEGYEKPEIVIHD